MNGKTAGWIGLAAMLALGAGCFRNTVSTIELDVPAMRTDACGRAEQDAVAKLGEGAIRDIRVDVAARKAWVDYDNVRLGRRNVEVTIRHAGFAVNDLPADEDARKQLPPDCQ